MELNEYQNLARQTAIYPEEHGLTYTILGLIGEAGEYLTNPSIDEKGDNFWYIAQIAYELKLPLSALPKMNVNGNKSYIETVTLLANTYKKVLRDHNGVLTGNRRHELILLLAGAFTSLCNDGYPNEEAMKKNIDKLFSRKTRGVLGGSGDDR